MKSLPHKKRLVLLAGEFYLVDADNYMIQMAKDYTPGTKVFCVGETHMNDPKECIRHSSSGDHCFSCLPLIASTVQIDDLPLLDKSKCEEAIKTAKSLPAQVYGTEWEILEQDLYKTKTLISNLPPSIVIFDDDDLFLKEDTHEAPNGEKVFSELGIGLLILGIVVLIFAIVLFL